MITLVGALLTAALPIVKYERWWYEPVPGGAFVDAMAVLKVLHGGARLTGTAMVTSAQIRACTRIGYDEMTELLERMVAAGWVGRVHVEELVPLRWRMGKGGGARAGTDCWVLLVDPRLVRLADVYRLFVFGGIGSEAGPPADGAQSPLALDTAALARQVEASVERGLDETLAEHFENVPVGEVTS
jgi:membrane protein